MQRIGIFGGSFNPIHEGHLAVAQSIIAAHQVDEVWLMISPQNPLKQASELAPEALRFAMAQRAVQNIPHLRVSDFEWQLPRPSFTWRTMEALRSSYPELAFSLIIGADNWHNFSRWAKHEQLLQEYPLWVYPREGYPIDATSLPNGVQLIDAPLFPYSSTDIRERLQQGRCTRGMLPEEITELAKTVYAVPPQS